MFNQNRWNLIKESVSALNAVGSSTTRTHIHKTLYLGQAISGIDVPFKFVLHHYGPYSFDLDGEIMSMESFGQLHVSWDLAGYGGRYAVEPVGAGDAMKLLAEWLGPKSARQLEALATVQFVKDANAADIVGRVQEIKPHLREEEIRDALAEVSTKQKEFGEQRSG